MNITNGGTIVTMPLEKYEALKATWDATQTNADLYISKGAFYVAYIIKTESELVKRLTGEIRELQEQIAELKQDIREIKKEDSFKNAITKTKWWFK